MPVMIFEADARPMEDPDSEELVQPIPVSPGKGVVTPLPSRLPHMQPVKVSVSGQTSFSSPF
jgi:hypothetical protein